MHIYIYDNYLNEKKYQPLLAKIETRITDLGLNGKIIRLGVMNSIYNAIENELKKGAKTIIAVGNDNLLNQVINSIIKSNTDNKTNIIPIGFIPVGKKNNELAKFLGIELEENACDILSARRVKQLSLGKINNLFFLFNVSITTKDTIINIDKDFSIEIKKEGIINIINTSLENRETDINSSLELLIQTNNSGLFKTNKSEQSHFKFKHLALINKKSSAVIDNSMEVPTPVEISLGKEKINLIVGKNRFF
ncbi:acylglycerol kinase family protein [Candidatus Parcubacteria bacterium]|nr:acylglycerol kinase family protein [Patescibacteria group bacterium]MBU4309698.1 acylglycerol kinase family protein [Patescibacteria group bacterium]MBU4431678.1 acylglycerol kinase family protein [Patescibacteria group bacterium]MBU4577914.1 acylglycerol kinase family protein [Patescibacteria group bacterium]MCG2696576.1 acylglycerol kinase family protein [Candidatus Parcubacteria bacterium]